MSEENVNEAVETKEVAVSQVNDMVLQESANMSEDAFQMTIEQAEKQIGLELAMYELVKSVASKLLNSSDKYYMSQLNNKNWKEPKKDEKPVLKKQAVDKLLTFFKIKLFPAEEKIDGGYQVTVIGKDRQGGYIDTGRGTCTRYEKKYEWVKASDDEYSAANESDRRIKIVKYDSATYKNKQIKTDERAIAHTLSSMAEKRARAAFVRKIMPDLDDVAFEGEEYEANFQHQNDEEPSKSNQVMSDTEIKDYYAALKAKHEVKNIKEAFREITGSETLGGLTFDQSLNITTYMVDNFGKADG